MGVGSELLHCVSTFLRCAVIAAWQYYYREFKEIKEISADVKISSLSSLISLNSLFLDSHGRMRSLRVTPFGS